MATIKCRADFYKDTEYFCQYNNNPTYKDGQRWTKGDCVIRAFALAANIIGAGVMPAPPIKNKLSIT